MKPETKFYAQVKRNLTEISWIRIENLSVPGTPDLLGYNNSGHFFTVKHPHNTFIMVLDASCGLPKLYEGKKIRELVAGGLNQAPCAIGYAACRLTLDAL